MNSIRQRYGLRTMMKSKFIRNLLLKIITIVSVIVILVIVIVFFSFASELNTNIIEEKQKQLIIIEDTISKRMNEVASIAYNIGEDSSFYLENINDVKYSGYELANVLDRYLVGNDFISYIAYYRLSEKEVLYTSQGEIPIHDFYDTYLDFKDTTEGIYTTQILNSTGVNILPMTETKTNKGFLTYVYGLPELAKKPQAYVLMWISKASLQPVLDTQMTNCIGVTVLFDSAGNQIEKVSNLEEDLKYKIDVTNIPDSFKENGEKYICLSQTSTTNGWVYVTILRQKDIISKVATKQIEFIAILLIVMVIAVIAMLLCIVAQYRPINDLALQFTNRYAKDDHKTIDEESILSDTLLSLKGDSNLKQHYETAYLEAEAANKAKSAFLSNMSHDIRTPMNAIIGMTDIALKHLNDQEYVRECLDNVRVSSQYLLDIINNVLDMSRIESGKMVIAQDIVELPKVIYGIITILNHSLEEKELSFDVEVYNIENEKIIGDTVRLTQVFMNILSNSVKFTPRGGKIRLVVNQFPSEESEYGDYKFVFSDNGIGMSEEFAKKVFDSFARDDKSGANKIEGTGLGMTIAKHFVEMMGGTIQCDSVLGEGTTFTVCMHVQLAKEQENKYLSDDGSKIRVLIMDKSGKESPSELSILNKLHIESDCFDNILVAARMMKNANVEGNPYKVVIVNETLNSLDETNMVKALSKVALENKPVFVLASRDFLGMDKTKKRMDCYDTFLQLPAFTSYMIDLLNKTYEQKSASVTPTIDMEGKRVLLVEDNAINRQIAEAIISETKAIVYEAENGKEAVEAIMNHEIGYFDVVLMDVQMPVKNGYEATAEIRTMNRSDASIIPIYAMTANTFDEDVRQVKEAGMNGHLGKPYVAEELYKILQEAVQRTGV